MLSLRIISSAASLFGLLGLGLLLGGVDRLREKGLPPFNDGLYSAVWSFPAPPSDWIRLLFVEPSKYVLWACLVVLIVGSIRFLSKDRSKLIGFAILLLWSSTFFVLGVWTWVFSLLN